MCDQCWMIDDMTMDKTSNDWLMCDNILIILQMLLSMLIGWYMMGMFSGFVHWHVMSQWILSMDCRCIFVVHMMWCLVMRCFMMCNYLWVNNLLSNFMQWLSMMSWQVRSYNLLVHRGCMVNWFRMVD